MTDPDHATVAPNCHWQGPWHRPMGLGLWGLWQPLAVRLVWGLLVSTGLAGLSGCQGPSTWPQTHPPAKLADTADQPRLVLASPNGAVSSPVTAWQRQATVWEEQITRGDFETALRGLREAIRQLSLPAHERPDRDWPAADREALSALVPRCQYWLAFCLEQTGELDKAVLVYLQILSDHTHTPWRALSEARLAGLVSQTLPL